MLPKIIDRADIAKILNQPNIKTDTGLRNRVILQVLYRCGLRVSEAVNLTVNDVDIERGFIYVQRGKRGSDRFVPMEVETVEWISKWMARRPDSDWLFLTLAGWQLNVRYVRQMLSRIAKSVGVYIHDGSTKRLPSPHNLRHSFAAECIEDGLSVRDVQELLGHVHVGTTSIYLSVQPTGLADRFRARPGSTPGI